MGDRITYYIATSDYLALINFTRELNKINDPEFINFYDKFKNIKSEDIDIVYQKANTEKKLILK